MTSLATCQQLVGVIEVGIPRAEKTEEHKRVLRTAYSQSNEQPPFCGTAKGVRTMDGGA